MKALIQSAVAGLFGLFTKENMEARISEAKFLAHQEKMKQDEQEQQDIKAICIEIDIGKLFISVTNEWDNPTIGVVLGVEYVTAGNCPIAKVYDFITNTVVLCGNSRIPFTYHNLDAILKLDPYQRWNLLAKSSIDHDKPKYNEDCFSADEIRTILDVRNFDSVSHELNRILSISTPVKTHELVEMVYSVLRLHDLNVEME